MKKRKIKEIFVFVVYRIIYRISIILKVNNLKNTYNLNFFFVKKYVLINYKFYCI